MLVVWTGLGLLYMLSTEFDVWTLAYGGALLYYFVKDGEPKGLDK